MAEDAAADVGIPETIAPDGVSSAYGRDAPSFKIAAGDILPRVNKTLQSSKQALDSIAAVEEPTFKDVVAIAEEAANLDSLGVITFLGQVSDSKDVRDAISQAYEVISDYEVEMSMRSDLYRIVQAVANANPGLDVLEQRMLDRMLRGMLRNGLDRPVEVREQIQSLQQKIHNIAKDFAQNLAEDTNGVWFTKQELDGVTPELIDSWETREVNGTVEHKMTFAYPDVGPTIRLAKLESTRKKAWLANDNRVPQNAQLLVDIVSIRRQLTSLLKYDTYAAYVLEPKMAKEVSTVMGFLNNLKHKALPLGMQEWAVLAQLKQEMTNWSAPMREWDRAWTTAALMEAQFALDIDVIAEYFEMDRTIAKMLDIYAKLFSLEFREVTKADDLYETWHEDVRQFSVYRTDTNVHLGWLYMDMFPRDGKFGHAANWTFRTKRTHTDGRNVSTATALVCNFSKPSTSKPSLLKHSEVKTLFHELGHGIHSLLIDTGSIYFGNMGSIEPDFLEAPSQMLENWCYSSSVLKQLSSHYDTGEALSDAQIKSIQDAHHVGRATSTLRAVAFSMFDMTLHTTYTGTTIEEMTALWSSLMSETGLADIDGANSLGYAAFAHIVDGYEAGYYGYLWAQVFSADMYRSKFLDHENDSVVGAQYRDMVLKPGGSRDALQSLTEFLGRPPNSDAFLHDLGLE